MLHLEKCKVRHFRKSKLKAIYCITDISGNEINIEKNETQEELRCELK